MLTGRAAGPVPGMSFLDAWSGAGDGGAGYTWDNVNPFARQELGPDERIDFILTGWSRARGAGHVVRCEVCGNSPVDGVWPSDHFAVVADLLY